MSFEFKDNSSNHQYRTEIPNIIWELGLDPWERDAYSYFKKISGDSGQCYQKNETIAKKMGIGITKLKEIKKKLASHFDLINGPLIKLTERKNTDGTNMPTLIEIVDIWPQNYEFIMNQKRSQNDQKPVAKRQTSVVMRPIGGRQTATEEEPIEEDPIIEKKNIKKKSPEKKMNVRDHVILTEDEIRKIKEIYRERTDEALDILEAYKHSTGKKYASDYGAMKTGGWLYKKIFENKEAKHDKKFIRHTNIRDDIHRKQLDEYKKHNGEFGSTNTRDFSQET